MAEMGKPLRLLAQDVDDLGVLSAALQDAVAKIGDIRWDAQARTLTIACNRFRWEAAQAKQGQRVRSALKAGRITVEPDSTRLLDITVLLGRDFAPAFDFHP